MKFTHNKRSFTADNAKVYSNRTEVAFGNRYEKAYVVIELHTPSEYGTGETDKVYMEIAMQATLTGLRPGDKKVFYCPSMKTDETHNLDGVPINLEPNYYNKVRCKAFRKIQKVYRDIILEKNLPYGQTCALENLLDALKKLKVTVTYNSPEYSLNF